MAGQNITLGASGESPNALVDDDQEISAGELADALSGEVDEQPGGRQVGPGVAGVALVAADTGRVLMIQRALDDDDAAAGTWEFPGGHIEPGDISDVHGALREWSEEVGRPFPTGASHAHQWDAPGGVYRGHVFVIGAESQLDLAAPRVVDNPDDDSEQVAWWDPRDARKNPALRRECRTAPWDRLGKVAGEHAESKAPTLLVEVKAAGAGPHTPPQGVQSAAQRGLDLVKAGKAGPGFTGVGRKRAADLARGAAVSTATVKRMLAYFDRHQADRGAHWGKAGAETPGYVAWQCWGGDAGYAWARKVSGQAEGKSSPVQLEVKAGALQASERARTGKDAPPSRLGPDGKPLDKDKGGKKRKVASKAGEARYGLPIGTELGNARDAKAKSTQGDKAAQDLYEKLRGTDPREYRAFLDKLSDADLEKLSGLLYSGKSSNPAIVQARIAIAGALKRRGKDVNDHGGLGKRAPGKPAPKGAAASADPTWLPGEGWQARKARRQKLGLSGGAGTRPPSAKQKRGEGGRTMTLHVYEDGSWQYKGIRPDATVEPEGWVLVTGQQTGVEVKARTTTKPSQTRKAQRAGDTIGKAKSTDSDGGDEYPIKTIGDVATALKRAKNIKDPDRKKTVMAHIRSKAKGINAGHMVPKTDDADKGTGKGKSGKGDGPPQFIKDKMNKKSGDDGLEYGDAAEVARWIERKVMSPDPRAVKLREYWAHGEGVKKWRPGSPGDFDRLKRAVREYIPKHMLNGFVANVHKLATGEWPGKNAHGKKSAGLEGVETVLTPADLAEAKVLTYSDRPVDQDDPLADDDAVTLALDAYADMAGDLTTDEEYEQALAENVDWDMLADGDLVPSGDEPPASVKRARERVSYAEDEDEDEPFDPDAALDALEADAMMD